MTRRRTPRMACAAALALAMALAIAAACTRPAPRPIAWNDEVCRHCHMTIADPRFAAELVTSKGRVHAFDDVSCLAAFVRAGAVRADQVHSLWVYDYLEPGSLRAARRAIYLEVDTLWTPMGSHLLALRPGAAANSLRSRLGGRLLDWDALPARGHGG